MPFPAPLDLRHMPGAFYLTISPFPYVGARDRWTVPAGFRTDLTSVPRACRWLIDVGGDHAPAAVQHDYLCRAALITYTYDDAEDVVAAPPNRSDIDGIFRRLLDELRVSAPRRWLMWAAVRVGCGMQNATPMDWYLVLLIGMPAVLFLLLPVLVALVFGGAFRLLEEVVRVVSDRCSRTSFGGLS